MAKSPFETPEFRKLQKTWYKKAAESGFHDIEDPETGELEGTKHNVSIDAKFTETEEVPYLDQLVRNLHPNVSATATYYAAAEQFLEKNKVWKKAGDKAIWRLHAAGESVRSIAATTGRPSSTVHDRIQAMEKRANLQRREKKAKPG